MQNLPVHDIGDNFMMFRILALTNHIAVLVIHCNYDVIISVWDSAAVVDTSLKRPPPPRLSLFILRRTSLQVAQRVLLG